MSSLDHIALSIEKVMESVAVIKEVAGTGEEWAVRFERAVTAMLTVAEELAASFVEAKGSFGVLDAGSIKDMSSRLDLMISTTEQFLVESTTRAEAQQLVLGELNRRLEELSGLSRSIPAEFRQLTEELSKLRNDMLADFSSAVENVRAGIVSEVNKLAVSLPALHDTLPHAVARQLESDLKDVRADVARLGRELTSAVAKGSSKTASDVSSDVVALTGEVRALREAVDELANRKKGLFRG